MYLKEKPLYIDDSPKKTSQIQMGWRILKTKSLQVMELTADIRTGTD